ncbi:hypothetical protein PsorP6_001688 [Peronosclerospora sorghi]|uniref:Uncharacterized protein n=1 Tax=Peronosclerospora sorghi TaxID=230839 RepID=A0ACC0WU72_9STRA|nr:hypothetical protein PsorP6_001688 [Peronosclerospora sorghi]
MIRVESGCSAAEAIVGAGRPQMSPRAGRRQGERNFATAGPKLSVKEKSVAKTDVLFKNSPSTLRQILDLPGTECLQDLRTDHLNFLIKNRRGVSPWSRPACERRDSRGRPHCQSSTGGRNFREAIYTNTPDPTLNLRDGFPFFRTVIEANHIERRADVLGCQLLTADEEKQILRLSKQPDIAQRLINSIEPYIYGHHQVKTALARALFGGKAKFINNSRVLCDLNVLIEGNPGTAKSQFLKSSKQTAPRASCVKDDSSAFLGGREPFVRKDLGPEFSTSESPPGMHPVQILNTAQRAQDAVCLFHIPQRSSLAVRSNKLHIASAQLFGTTASAAFYTNTPQATLSSLFTSLRYQFHHSYHRDRRLLRWRERFLELSKGVFAVVNGNNRILHRVRARVKNGRIVGVANPGNDWCYAFPP